MGVKELAYMVSDKDVERREKANIAWLEYTSEYPNNWFFVFVLWRTLYDLLFSSYH